MERLLGALRVAVEKPLGRVVAVGLGQTVGVFLGGDFLPVLEVEGDFDESSVCDIKLLVNFSYCFVVIGRSTITPNIVNATQYTIRSILGIGVK